MICIGARERSRSAEKRACATIDFPCLAMSARPWPPICAAERRACPAACFSACGPRVGAFGGPGAVTTIVRRALARADLHPPVRGAHLLRHSLATQLLRHGASFAEIGAVLRHRAAGTTEIYAKVDLKSLRAVVQPWPDAGATQ